MLDAGGRRAAADSADPEEREGCSTPGLDGSVVEEPSGLDPVTVTVIKCGPMATPGRLAANRQNAFQSTGPRSPEGKAVACQNARTHGLLSRQVLLPDEDADQLAAVRQQLHAQLAPAGALETLLADEMVAAAWRLRRLHRVEAEVFAVERARLKSDGMESGVGVASDVLAKLSRYETPLKRAFYRALHELQRLQAVRAGQAVSPPVAVDVDVMVAHLDGSDEGDDA